MAIVKVLGTETEFGITVRRQPDFNPVLSSSQVVNAYRGGRARIQWSFEEESPGRDARGLGYEAGVGADLDTGLVNVVLTNGARLYVDHAHPEYSTPECIDPLQAALYDKAGETIMAKAVAAVQEGLVPPQRILVHKNNSDGKGNSYGAHENYLIARELPFGDLVRYFTTFLVTRQVFTGSGKVGAENGRPQVAFQLTQRADFFEEEVGLETTLKRPLINTRDEPHGDVAKYRRFHVIMGDATMSELQTFLKLGSAALVLAAIEDGALPDSLTLADPVTAAWRTSHDITLQSPLQMADGGTATPLELQWQYFEWACKYAEAVDMGPAYDQVTAVWEEILNDLEVDPHRAVDKLDWVAKKQVVEGYRERDSLAWDDPKLRMAALQYHDVDPDRGIYNRLAAGGRMARLFSDEEIAVAVVQPPADTRAYFRGRCVDKYGSALVAANWDSLVFDVGEEALKRVPMMEPLRGSRQLVGALLDDSDDAPALMRALGGEDGGAGTQTDQA